MGAVSAVHWLILLLIWFVPIFPIWRILRRLGINPAWSLLYALPLINLIGLFLLAWARWPRLPEAAAAQA